MAIYKNPNQTTTLLSAPVRIDNTDNKVKITDGTDTLAIDASGNIGANIQGNPHVKITDGTEIVEITASNALKVDASGTTQPISGSISNTGFNITDGANVATLKKIGATTEYALKVDGSDFTQSIKTNGSDTVSAVSKVSVSGGSLITEKAADLWTHAEFGAVNPGGGGFNVYECVNSSARINVHVLTVQGTHDGPHELRFENQAGTSFTTFFKFYGARGMIVVDFKGAVVSPYIDGRIRMINNGTSSSNCEFNASLSEV